MIEMTVEKIRVRPCSQVNVIVLKAKGLNRCLPIWIGPKEAEAIALRLLGKELPRPLTHDLMDLLIGDLGAKVEWVIVRDLEDETFLASVILQSGDTTIERDARPSDAIALAVRSGAPIFAQQSVLDRAGVTWDPEKCRPEHIAFDLSYLSMEDLEQMLSEEVKDILQQAALRSKGLGHNTIEPEDVMDSLMRQSECAGARVINDLGVDPHSIKARLEYSATVRSQASDATPKLSESSRRVLRSAKSEAANLFDVLIETEHLLLGFFLLDKGFISQILRGYDIGIERARAAVVKASSQWEVSPSITP